MLRASPNGICESGQQMKQQARKMTELKSEVRNARQKLSEMSGLDESILLLTRLEDKLLTQMEQMNRMGQLLDDIGQQYRECEERNIDRAETSHLAQDILPAGFFDFDISPFAGINII